jgi:hypothetical protein
MTLLYSVARPTVIKNQPLRFMKSNRYFTQSWSHTNYVHSKLTRIENRLKLDYVLVNCTTDKMTSHCDKSDVARTHPCWHKVTPFDDIGKNTDSNGINLLQIVNWGTKRMIDVVQLNAICILFYFSHGVRLSPHVTASTVWPIVPAPDVR